MKRIIIQGDDLAYNSYADEGIFSAYEQGILTSTTVMANLLSNDDKNKYSDRIVNLKNKSGLSKPALGVGVHLNVTFGKPLTKSWPQDEFTRPLKGSGKSEEWQGSTWKEYFTQFTPEQIEAEYRMQIERALDFFPTIDHLDSHHFSASYEPLKSVYEKLALEYNLAVRADAPLSENSVYGGDFAYTKEASKTLKNKGIKTAHNYISKLFFNEENPRMSFIESLINLNELPGNVTEIMFHPAVGDRADGWRIKDFKVLTDTETITYCKENEIKLVTYSDL